MSDDPYRILEVERGAPIAEIRRAYRRLAKANHPDSAGPAALPRFLAIQSAYEELVEGKLPPRDVGRAPSNGTGSDGRAGPAWRADPERARATRETWRRRSSRPSGSSRGAEPGGPADGSRPGGKADGPPPDGTGPGAPEPGEAETREQRDGSRGSARNRATPGSTTYDGADREPFDPEWGGASWYGPSSGTYWTINPKEYADPRKHGPEYQARARRGAVGRGPGLDPIDAAGQGSPDRGWPPPPPPERRADPPPDQAARARPQPRHRPQAAPSDGTPAGSSGDPAGTASANGPPDAPPAAAAAAAAAALHRRPATAAVLRDPGRLLAALIAWPPIGLAFALAFGEVSGCARFAVECVDATTPLPWAIQIATLAALLALPALAGLAVLGTYAILIAAVPLTLFLMTGGRAGSEVAPTLLFAGLTVAWMVGVGVALVRRLRRAGRVNSAPPVP